MGRFAGHLKPFSSAYHLRMVLKVAVCVNCDFVDKIHRPSTTHSPGQSGLEAPVTEPSSHAGFAAAARAMGKSWLYTPVWAWGVGPGIDDVC